MRREQRIVETFVSLVATVAEEFDVVELLHALVGHCVELLDCAEAGLLLADAGGGLRVMASSSERAQALEILESQNAEGPCFDCYRTGTQVVGDHLETARYRWPAFVPAALEAGVGSVQAIPMRASGRAIGALSLLRTQTDRLTNEDLVLAQGLADIAAIALVQQRTRRESRDVLAQLQAALSSRVVIEQAKGILAQQARVGVDAAFAWLRAHARHHNRRLGDVARDVVDGQLSAGELVRPDDSASGR